MNPVNRQTQRGAVLYVALIMLVLLALIGITGMQIATLQERMSANYMTGSMAFQRAESTARARENELKADVAAGNLPTLDIVARDCQEPFNPATWSSTTPHTRRLDLCFSWGGLDMAIDEAEKTDQIFQVTAFNTDRNTAPSAEAIVNTVFIP